MKGVCLVAAGVKVTVLHKGKSSTNVAITNMTSIPYVIRQKGGIQMKFDPFQTLWFTVPDMFCSKEGHPIVKLVY